MLRRGLWLWLWLLAAGCRRGDLKNFANLPLPLDVWKSHIAGRLTDGWVAKPGEVYRVLTRWSGAGQIHLCLHAGRVDPPDYDLDDAIEKASACPPQDPSGLSVAEVRVPNDANGVWYTTQPEGGWATHIQIRFEKP